MLLHRVEAVEGERPGRLRVQGVVRYDADGQEERMWFEFPATSIIEATDYGNAWLAALLPLAATLNEPLRIEPPVDPLLLEGCHRLLEVWSTWIPRLAVVAIDATPLPPREGALPAGTGLFFSGGVDSFFSLLRHNGPLASPALPRVTDLLLLHGMDIRLHHKDAFDRLRLRMKQVADRFGTGLVDIATNLRDTRWNKTDWGRVSHGAILLGAGLLLGSRYCRLLVASSAPYGRLQPCGTHPITDPLFSTSRTQVRHDGASAERIDKIQAVAADPLVLQHLRVCWLAGTDSNCGVCPKCVLTMVGLELAGSLWQAGTLPTRLDVNTTGRLYLEKAGMYPAYTLANVYRDRARAAGRGDVVSILNGILHRSDRLRYARHAIEGMRRIRLLPDSLSRRLTDHLFRRVTKY